MDSINNRHFRGYKLSELSINYSIRDAINALRKCKLVFLDTETMGFTGICFLIQFATNENPKEVHLIMVLKEIPAEVIELLGELVKKTWAIHNGLFDNFHLSKLYTISKRCSDYSFESIWKAESIFRRDESTYEGRLAACYALYPKKVIDTMLVAQHTFPFGDEFLKKNGYALYDMPYLLVDNIKEAFISDRNWSKMLISQMKNEKIVDYVLSLSRFKISVKNSDTKKKKALLKFKPDRYIVGMGLSYEPNGFFSLKNIGRFYEFVESDRIKSFDFLDNFPPMKKIKKLDGIYKTPTIENRTLYQTVYNRFEKQYDNSEFMDYSTMDITLLQTVHYNQIKEESYSQALEVDMALVPYFANFKLYGVHVDDKIAKEIYEKTNRKMGAKEAELANLPVPLYKPTSSPKVKDWLIGVVANHLRNPTNDEEIKKLVPDSTKDTINDLAKRFPKIIGLKELKEFKELKNLSQHIPCNKDTIFPSPFIYSTVTNRMTFTKPNAQGIPPKARPCFTPPSGYSMCVGDFDQLEVRLVAYLFQIQNLMKALKNGDDPHSQTICAMNGKELKDIKQELKELASKLGMSEKEVRGIGKRLGFAVMYGTSSKSLASELDCNIKEAEKYIDDYFKVNPELKRAIEKSHEKTIRIVIKVEYGKYRQRRRFHFDDKPIETITNMFGTRRNFTMNRCAARLLFHLANDRQYISNQLSHLPTKYKNHFIKSVKSAYRSIQASIKREAFNFVIQSTGSYLTKKLQVEICKKFISAGAVHKIGDLDIIPSLNIHDELHFYYKGTKAKELLDQTKEETLAELSRLVGGPLGLSFSTVESWAEKE